MKKISILGVLFAASLAALAQGKVSFANDSLHLVYYTPDPSGLRAADAALAGQGVTSSAMPAGMTLVADLYAGTSSTSLSLITTTAFSSTVGRFASVSVNLPIGLAGGVSQFFQVQIRDNAFATADAAWAGGAYAAKSTIFTTVANSGIAYNSIVNTGPPANSTWAPGTFDMSTQTGLPGARGVIMIGIPEPSVLGLVGLALLVVRSRWAGRKTDS